MRLTDQQFLDTVYGHFITEKHKFGYAPEEASCQYRVDPSDPTSAGCAIGCCIPNDKYDPGMDHGDDGDGNDGWMCEKFRTHMPEVFGALELGLMREAQGAHDQAAAVQDYDAFANDLDRIASKYKLSCPGQ